MLTLSKTFVLLGQFLSNKNREHKVLEGDSLEWLAAKYGTTVKALKKLNNMKDDIIYSGRYFFCIFLCICRSFICMFILGSSI